MRVSFVVAILASSVVAAADEPDATCLRDPVSIHHLRRPREVIRISLTDCEGRANLDALTELSLVARAWHTPRPSEEELGAYVRDNPERSRAWISARRRWRNETVLRTGPPPAADSHRPATGSRAQPAPGPAGCAVT